MIPKPQFANEDNLDFQDVSDKKAVQEFDIAQGREVGEYAVKYVFLDFRCTVVWC